ncbi:TetR/AcrR family transcriptional regulator [Xylella fastidiosa]|uniref:AcrR family transcriptional regulator n=1 Tax=Xylella fastidiosa subsp. sandyi Ann-1 TaxID=155920 RepID=A0A060H7G0_XYLFS|nr:TetR/AcrR family transcriptional regulator [Xylella fastidiosa]AIC11503.1 AcrR family transcriptional regulator [Xylella fastidiosa subsp. sandyi Ann-1]UIX80594.1 TetR/AcrR family transcriptional regulator [Xylella fastidiosa subsp. sandyi]
MIKAYTSASQLRQPQDHDVRDQIVKAATEYFGRYGYEKTTVSDLAKAIGFSKAYIYRFFDSKQAIGQVICSNRLSIIITSVDEAVANASTPPEQLRRMFKTLVEAGNYLFFHDRKLYDIAATSISESWPSVGVYEEHIKALVLQILRDGRESGEFERKTPLDETLNAIYLVMRPYINPLMLQHNLDNATEITTKLSNLILRSLAP